MTAFCVILLSLLPFAYVYAKLEPVAFSGWCLALCSGLCNPWAISLLAGWLA
jgi:hypothetical protein